MTDPVNHPAHYTAGAVECIDAIEAALGPAGFIAYCRGQVLKYLWRLEHKGKPLQDMQKAEWYLARMLATVVAQPHPPAGVGPLAPYAAPPVTQDAPQPASGEAGGRRQGFKAREYHATPQAPQGRAVKL